MPTSLFGLARERLKAIAEGLTGFAGKCAVLSGCEAADVEAWRRYTPGAFVFLAIGGAGLSMGAIESPGAVNVYLYAQTDADGESLDDLIAALRAAWLDTANYPGGELACADVTFEAPETLVCEPGRAFLRLSAACYFAAE